MESKNVFQLAVRELQKLPQVGPRFVRIYNGSTEAKLESEADEPISIQVHGFGDIRGANLEDAVGRMKKLVAGEAVENFVDAKPAAAAPAAAAPLPSDFEARIAAAVAAALKAQPAPQS